MSHLLTYIGARLLLGVAMAINRHLRRWSVPLGVFFILLGLGAMVPMFLELYGYLRPNLPDQTVTLVNITVPEYSIFVGGFCGFIPIILGIYTLLVAYGRSRQSQQSRDDSRTPCQ